MAKDQTEDVDEKRPLISHTDAVTRPKRKISPPVELILILYFVAAMLLVPIEQLYVFERTSNDRKQNKSARYISATGDIRNKCKMNNSSQSTPEDEAQTDAANWLLILTLCENFSAMLSTCLLATVIDRKGRKFGLVIPLIGTLVKVCVFMLVVWFSLPLGLLLVGDIIEGSSGYYALVTSAALAYIADITQTIKTRSTRITRAVSMNGIGIGLTYLVSGFLIDAWGFFYPMIVSLSVILIALPVTIFLLPETIDPSEDINKGSDLWSLTRLLSTFGIYFRSSGQGRRWKLVCLASAFFCFSLVTTGRGSVQSLHQLSSPFCWTATELGYFGAAQTIGHQAVTLLIFPPLSLIVSEVPLGVLGAFSSLASCVLQALAKNSLMMYMVTVVSMFQMFVPPCIKIVMSSLAGQREQGAVFASLGIISMVCSCVSQVIFNSVYAASLSVFPGAVFLVMAVFFFGTGILLIITYIGMKAGR